MKISRVIRVLIQKNKITLRKLEGLKMVFNVEQSNTSEPNSCELQIYNLTDETINFFKDPDIEINVECGYEGATTQIIFWGNNIELETSFNGSDKITLLKGKDGGQQLSETKIKYAVPANTSIQEIVKNVVSKMKNIAFNKDQYNKLSQASVETAFGLVTKDDDKKTVKRINRKLKNSTKSILQGTVREILENILNPLDIEFFINFGSFNIFLPKEYPTDIENIDKTSGILRQPETNERTIRLSIMLNPRIYPGVFFYLDSKKVKGVYRVTYSNHYGDNFSSPWVTEIEAIPL